MHSVIINFCIFTITILLVVSSNFLQIEFNSPGGQSYNMWIKKKKISFPILLSLIAFCCLFALVSSMVAVFHLLPHPKVIDSNILPEVQSVL